jgi:hypothetical protein
MSWLPGTRTPAGYADDLSAWVAAVTWARKSTEHNRPSSRAGYNMLADGVGDPLRADALRAIGDACAPVASPAPAPQFAEWRTEYVRKPLRPMTGGDKDEDAVFAALAGGA